MTYVFGSGIAPDGGVFESNNRERQAKRMSARKRLRLGKAVRVVWVDSITNGGWQYNTLQRIGQLGRITSLGYVVKTTDDALVLSTSIGANEAVLDPVAIPKKCIIDLQVLGEEWDRQHLDKAP